MRGSVQPSSAARLCLVPNRKAFGSGRGPEGLAGRSRRPSPVLGTAATLIGEASDTLVRPDSRFRHSFEVPLDTIRSDPDQARKVFDETEIKMLAITMTEHGQLQPILLRKDPEAR